MKSMSCGSERKKHLVILSVPFLRIARVLLGSPVLDTIRNNQDVLIVGPHAENPYIRADFSGPGINFFKLNLTTAMHPLEWRLEAIASIQRMHGYWFRHRNTEIMAYYYRNAIFSISKDGEVKRFSLMKAILYRLISITGYWRLSWRITDSLIDFLFRKSSDLDAIVATYEKITLVQSVSWGQQDTFLARLARKKKFHTIFIPYSTDQLFTNGFLLCDYDAVCVQGTFEENCATQFHSVPKNRQIHLGSAWFRNIDKIFHEITEQQRNLNIPDVRIILFSGHSAQYFPKESEYRALAYLEKAVSKGIFGKAKIIYRPLVVTLEDIQRVFYDWGGYPNIEIQLPQIGIIGLEHHPNQSIKTEWLDYIAQLQKIDILVMTFISSLAIDAVYLGKPVIALLDDPGGKISQTRVDLMFNSAGQVPGLEKLPLVHDIKDLVPMIRQILFYPSIVNEFRDSVISSWDFPGVNFSERLIDVLECSS